MKGRSSGRGHVIEPTSQIPRFVIGLFGSAGLVALMTIIALVAPTVIEFFRGTNLPNQNSTWLTTRWTETDPKQEDINALAEILVDNEIRTVYIQTNRWHGETGRFIELPYITSFTSRFREQAPTLTLYTWLIIEPDRLANPEARAQLVGFAAHAVNELGFDGVHLMARSVPDGSQDYLNLVRDLRATIGDEKQLSLAVPPDRIPTEPGIPYSLTASSELTWSQDYKERVLLYADEIVLMAHASGLTTAADYKTWTAYQVATYAAVVQDMALDITYLIAVPTYDAQVGHDPTVENPATTLDGILRGIQRADEAGQQIDGVGLYPWDETDLPELDTYWETWVQREE